MENTKANVNLKARTGSPAGEEDNAYAGTAGNHGIRTYKDRVFRMLFSEKAQFLSLYNAMSGTAYDNPEKLVVTTLGNAVYMGMHNDVSYLVYDRLALYEHQATVNPNMPLRVLVLNINQGYNQTLKENCKILGEYMMFVDKVREKTHGANVSAAVETAVRECIAEGILAEFLSRNRAEVMKVSIYEYDEEKHLRQEREASREDGLIEGMARGQKYAIIRYTQKMLQRGFEEEKIADLLAEELPVIQTFCKVLRENPDADAGTVYELCEKQNVL